MTMRTLPSLLLMLTLASAPAAAQDPTPVPADVAPAAVAAAPVVPVPGAPEGFEALSKRLLPTVVNVATTMRLKDGAAEGLPALPDMPQLPPGSPFEDFFKDFYERYQNAQPQGEQERNVSSLGSGFIIDADKGYIVTNNHVIKDADEIKVVLHDDTTLDATLIGTDEKTDIAVLQIKPQGKLAATNWGDSDNANVGSWIIAIGNPFGLGGTVTAGIVSARQRDINAGPYDDFIQTDASINRGNSGGPMFNMRGEVIGVNTAIFSPTGGSVGIGFAVPSNIAKSVVAQLVKYGETRRGWLGVRIQDVTPDIAESLGLGKAHGALISSVVDASPAATAGVKAGDIITAFEGHEVTNSRTLPRLVAEAEVGKTVKVTLWRDGAARDVTVALGQLEEAEKNGLSGPVKADPKAAKPAPAAGTKVEALGLSVASLSDALRQQHGIAKSVNGVVVQAVEPKGAAAEKGLQAGDVIIEANQQVIASAEDLSAAVTAANAKGRSSLLVFIARKDDRRFVALKLKK